VAPAAKAARHNCCEQFRMSLKQSRLRSWGHTPSKQPQQQEEQLLAATHKVQQLDTHYEPTPTTATASSTDHQLQRPLKQFLRTAKECWQTKYSTAQRVLLLPVPSLSKDMY
jgi:hypothetical protein